MRFNRTSLIVWTASLALSAGVLTACNTTSANGTSATASADSGKIPLTTKSEEARKEFLQGQDLADRLQGQESLQHFDKALALDPEFASAELARANVSPTAKEFFDHLKNAVNLEDKASTGEKLVIQANEAGTNGDAAKQKEYLDKLVAAYPNDERAHFAVGNYAFGQQDLGEAIEQFTKTAELAPNFSPVYNILGYAYRQQGNFAGAEQSFRKYIELIPNDPNPYDSYAELLLKEGKFDESIAQYRKALSVDPHFAASHFGISADLMYLGKGQAANAELQSLADQARNDGELRTALFGMAVVASDSGKFAQALQAMDKEFAVAQKKNDVASMAADLQAKGNILAEVPKYDEAKQQFDRSLELIQGSNLSQEIKDNATRLHHFNLAALAIGGRDLAGAKSHAEEFRQSAELTKNPVQIRFVHELAGRIALAEKDYDKAIAELQQANHLDPRNLYRIALAYQGKGNSTEAHDWLTQAAAFNSLPQLPYAFIRVKAQKMAASTKG
jgi:tetratricopeptide (TPR) repeat protein